MPTIREDSIRLQSLARKHEVCFEVWPEYLPVEGGKVKVGLEIDLCGSVDSHDPHYCAGCPRCEEAYAELKEIAEWALPPAGKHMTCEILPFDHAVHMSHGFRPEVVVAIHLANDHMFGPISDGQQAHCLASLSEKLASVGVTAR